jgi:uncharacterized protein
LQDPLAELVKIDPKSIGVGQYQHDIAPAHLKRSLDFVVDSCVNQVGVNLNTASVPLLSRVSGIGPALAKAVVDHRATKGVFTSRSQLTEVSRFSTKAFEQSAGFLRIPGAANPLDNTGVHPERYSVIEKAATAAGKSVEQCLGSGVAVLRSSIDMKNELGEFTFADVIAELEKPGRDPRAEFVPFSFREDIHELKDLKADMVCPGVVTNVTNFGAFVDIGVHQDGLVHLSQLSDRFVKDPREVVNPGDRVEVKVLEVNLDKKQIALTMKGLGKGAARGADKRDGKNTRPPRQRPPRDANAEGGRGPRKNARPPAPRPEIPSGPPPVSPLAKPAKAATPPSVKAKQIFKNNPFAALGSLMKNQGDGKK